MSVYIWVYNKCAFLYGTLKELYSQKVRRKLLGCRLDIIWQFNTKFEANSEKECILIVHIYKFIL